MDLKIIMLSERLQIKRMHIQGSMDIKSYKANYHPVTGGRPLFT